MNKANLASASAPRAGIAWSQIRPWFRDGLLIVALAMAMVSLDAPGGMAKLWMTIPIALFSILWTMIGPQGRPLQLPQLLKILALAGLLALHAIATLGGPLPAQGLHEAMDLGTIFILCVALWMMAGGEGLRAVFLWTAALGIGWFTHVLLNLTSEAPVTSEAGTFSLALGLIAGLLILVLAGWRLRYGDSSGNGGRPTVIVRLTILALGAILGAWWSILPSDLPVEQELPLVAGRHAVQDLWLQSILAGWGRHGVEPLANILSQPHPAAFHPWGGIYTLLAMGGLVGVGLLLTIAWMLLHRRARHLITSADRDPVPDGTVTVALLMVGLILGGGPISTITLLVFGGWCALAFARPAITSPSVSQWNPRDIAVTAAGAVASILLMILLGLPVRGNKLLEEAKVVTLTSRQQEQLLRRAEALNPFNPAIPLQLASVTRDQMNDAESWSEALFQRTIGAYRRAEKLNPYQTLIPMRLAQFQLLCKRDDDAIDTVRRAQDRQPYASDLCEWLYITSLRLNRPDEAYQALGRGLEMAPMDWRWWLRQFQMTNDSGQVILARQSLGVALTANPVHPLLQSEAWKAWGGGASQGQPIAPAEVQLPEPTKQP